MSYGLYQTFNVGLRKKDLTAPQKKDLLERFGKLDPREMEAVFMLVCEHASRNDAFVYDCENLELPYSITYDDGIVNLNLQKFPIPLRQILWKFSEVISNVNTE